MRCRLPIKASAVVLYTGWLLMLPPFDGHGSVDTDAPLSRWAHFISYDTAKACQDALVSASDSTRRADGKDGKGGIFEYAHGGSLSAVGRDRRQRRVEVSDGERWLSGDGWRLVRQGRY